MRTLYDILEIQSIATAGEIEEAYQRQRARLDAHPHKTRPAWRERLDEVEEAYAILSDIPARRAYDSQRQTKSAEPVQAEPAVVDQVPPQAGFEPDFEALRSTAEPPAMLASAKQTERGFEIALGTMAQIRSGPTVHRMRQRIPGEHLKFEAEKQTWIVPIEFRQELKELFLNFESALLEQEGARPADPFPKFELPAPEPPAATPRRPPSTPRPGFETFGPGQFPFNGIVIVVLAILIGWNFYAIRDRNQQVAAVPEPTPWPTRFRQPTETPVPTVTPTPFTYVSATLYPRVHLRSGPSVETRSLGFLVEGEEFQLIARTADSSWVQVMRGDQVGWSATWTLDVGEDLERLSIVTIDE